MAWVLGYYIPFSTGILLAILCALSSAGSDVARKVVVFWYSSPSKVILLKGAFQVPGFLLLTITQEGFHVYNENLFWTAVFISAIINFFTNLLIIRALQLGPLNATMPFLSLTPAISLVVASISLGEIPSFYGLLGILFITVGAIQLAKTLQVNSPQPQPESTSNNNISSFRKVMELFDITFLYGMLNEPGSFYILIVACLWSISSLFDKIGGTSGEPVLYGLLLQTLLCVPAAIWLIFSWLFPEAATVIGNSFDRKPKVVASDNDSNQSSSNGNIDNGGKNIKAVSKNSKQDNLPDWSKNCGIYSSTPTLLQLTVWIFLMGSLNFIAYFTYIKAAQSMYIAYVIAIKRSGIVLALILGNFMFREDAFSHRLGAATLMFIGVLFIVLA